MKLDFNEKSYLSAIICIYLLIIVAFILCAPLGVKGIILPVIIVILFVQILVHLLPGRNR